MNNFKALIFQYKNKLFLQIHFSLNFFYILFFLFGFFSSEEFVYFFRALILYSFWCVFFFVLDFRTEIFINSDLVGLFIF
ncbi:unnamed protein product [Meloidogyne enterolobii]|uniref:Uncharacterized protein n=1 Tax=Meloidogyne enterolobii TaxID=390850 RepID=A0ACB0ZAV9_MELEN